MASTITLQSVVDWARTQTKLIPIVGVGGFSNEPALSIANDVIQQIISRPFNWKWNRVEASTFDTQENVQDYTASISDLAWLEDAVAEDKNNTSPIKPKYDLEVVQKLQVTHMVDNPSKIAWLPVDATNVKFRLWMVPGSVVWTIKVAYQKKPPIKTSLSQTFDPIPDELGYVIRQGFFAMALRHAEDPRADREFLKFQALIQQALGNADAEQQAEGFYPERPLLIG